MENEIKIKWVQINYPEPANMTTTLITLFALAASVNAAAFSSYLTPNDVVGDGDGGDTSSTDYPNPTVLIEPVAPDYVVLPQNNCGYSDVTFDTSLNTFASNDTIWFYDTNEPSNCGPQNSDLGCVSQMYMTNAYSVFSYVPYTVWYYFDQVGDSTLVSLYWNYNNSATHLVGTLPCNGVQDYQLTLSKCMFSEELYQYKFFEVYEFNFYLSCDYNHRSGNVNFNLDQESITCVGGGTSGLNKNRFNLATFDNWQLGTTVVSNGAGEDFCPPPPPPPPTTSAVTTVTETVTPTTTSCTTTPTPTSTGCKSCEGGGIVININNSNSNTNTNTQSNNPVPAADPAPTA